MSRAIVMGPLVVVPRASQAAGAPIIDGCSGTLEGAHVGPWGGYLVLPPRHWRTRRAERPPTRGLALGRRGVACPLRPFSRAPAVAAMSVLLHARAVSAEHYCEIHTVREAKLLGWQRDALDQAMRWLLRASTMGALDLEDIEVGISELPAIDDDWEAGGDPGAKLLLPDPGERRGGAA